MQLYKHGLAYKKEMNVNWCTGCKCVLANEEVVNGVCERCGSEVVHRVKSQWMYRNGLSRPLVCICARSMQSAMYSPVLIP